MTSSEFSYEITARNPDYPLMRAGVILTPHGQIQTPAFIPVGTKASVKAVPPEAMKRIGAQALLANAYHLHLTPGEDVLDAAGDFAAENRDGRFGSSGLANFANWDLPTFTDSGGFQVMSLGSGYKKVISMTADDAQRKERSVHKEKLTQIDNDGVTFKSHLDGHVEKWTPEFSMQIQHKLGADIMFTFDELTTLIDSRAYQEESLRERTHPWAARCLEEHVRLTKERTGKPYQALFAVLQGANYRDLRLETAAYLANLRSTEADGNQQSFDGFGIGGAFEKEQLGDIIAWCSQTLNENGAESKPRHLLGISGVTDIFEGVENGVDTFDCVSPSREARNGAIYSPTGRYNLTNLKYERDFGPLAEGCDCETCANYSRAYVRHLIRSKEMLGSTLATIHNERFILRLVDDIRAAILDGTYLDFKTDFLNTFNSDKIDK